MIMKASEFVTSLEEYIPYFIKHCNKKGLDAKMWNAYSPYHDGYGFGKPYIDGDKIIMPAGARFETGKEYENYSRTIGEILSDIKELIKENGNKELYMETHCLGSIVTVTQFIVSYGNIHVIHFND